MMDVDDNWTDTVSRREQTLLKFILAQEPLRAALDEGPVVELHPAGEEVSPLIQSGTSVQINYANAAEALWTVGNLSNGCGVMVVRNTLQAVIETRQFLSACFSKVALGGYLVVIVPHQFLYERKLRLPSLRNPLHRRFYTPNTLLADIEEAIDPCEYRIRFLGENDEGYDYQVGLGAEPVGGQDIVVALERIVPPSWRARARGAGEVVDVCDQAGSVRPDQKGSARSRSAPSHRIHAKFTELSRSSSITAAISSWGRRLSRSCVLRFRPRRSRWCAVHGTAPRRRLAACSTGFCPFDFFPEDDSARLHTPARDVLIEGFRKQMAGNAYDLAIDFRLFDDTRDVLQRH